MKQNKTKWEKLRYYIHSKLYEDQFYMAHFSKIEEYKEITEKIWKHQKDFERVLEKMEELEE